MWAILPIRESGEWRCQDIDQVLLHEIIFSHAISVFSSIEVLGKNASIRSKLLTAACWSREEKRRRCKANLLYVESDFGTTDKSFTVFFARRGRLNLIVESKSRPVKLNNSTIGLHVPVEANEKLAIILFCGSSLLDFLPRFPCFSCDLIWPLQPRSQGTLSTSRERTLGTRLWPLMSRCVTAQDSDVIKTSHF